MKEDHDTRLKFIEAKEKVHAAHLASLQHCPNLRMLNYNGIATALKFPGAMNEISAEVAFQAALDAITEHPETTARLVISLLDLSYTLIFEVVGPEAVLLAVEGTLEMISVIGLAFNFAKYHAAKKDQRQPSKETDAIRETREVHKPERAAMHGQSLTGYIMGSHPFGGTDVEVEFIAIFADPAGDTRPVH